jgi:hypothetical protein
MGGVTITPVAGLARAPEPAASPVEQYANLMRLRQMQQAGVLQQQQGQINQEQLKQQQIATQQAAQQQKDQQSFRSLMADPANQGKTIGELADVAAQNNAISPQAYTAAKKADVEHRKSLAELDDKALQNRKAAHDQTQNLYNNVMNMPDAQLQANWGQIAQQYNAIPGNEKTPLDPSQPLSKQQLAQFGPLIDMGNAYFDEEMARRQKMAQTQKAEQEVQYGPTGPAADAKYDNIVSRLLNHQPVTPQEYQWAQGHRAGNQKQTSTSDSLGIVSTSQSGPAALPPMPGAPKRGGSAINAVPVTPTSSGSKESTKESLVDTIGQYKMDPALLGRAIYKHPELLGMIHAKYPDWDQTSYNAKNNIVKSYTSGPESKSINAISTALGHAGELGEAISALNNSDTGIKTLRAIGNRLGIEVGSDKVTAFNTIVKRLGPEIAAAYIQGGGGEAERIANEKDFDPALGGQQLRSNIAITIKLLRSKIAAQEQQWNNTYRPSRPEDDFSTRFLTPGAREALAKWSPEAQATPSKAAPTGNAVVDRLLKKHGF